MNEFFYNYGNVLIFQFGKNDGYEHFI